MQEDLPVAMAIVGMDPDGSPRFLFHTVGFRRLVGFDELAAGPTLEEFISLAVDEERESLTRAIDSLVRHREALAWKGRLVFKRHFFRHVTIESFPYRDAADDCVWQLLVTDWSDFRQLQNELESTRNAMTQLRYRYRRGLPVGNFTVEQPTDGAAARLAFVSDRLYEMLKIAPTGGAPVLAGLVRLIDPADRDRFRNQRRKAITQKLPFYWTGRIRVEDQWRWFFIESIPRKLPGGHPVWDGVVTDITDKKTAEDLLRRAAIEEREAEERYKRTLACKLEASLAAAVVAHEIKQPLASIILALQMALENAAEPNPVLENVLGEARRTVRIIERMRILLNMVEREHHPLDLRIVLDSAIMQTGVMLEEHGVVLEPAVDTQPLMIQGDETQLQLAICNLIRNGIEAIAQAGCTVRRISIWVGRRDKAIDLAIRDTGPGWGDIDPDQSLLDTTKPTGSGLGLYVVRTAMKHHGGTVTFRDAPDGGAEVLLSFPITRSHSSAITTSPLSGFAADRDRADSEEIDKPLADVTFPGHPHG